VIRVDTIGLYAASKNRGASQARENGGQSF
jgi:hypothetical protein